MISSGVTTAAKLLMLELLSKESCKVALYESNADIGPDTVAYTPVGEASGKGYRPGGVPLKNPRVWNDNGCACLTWDSPVIPVATVKAAGFLIYVPSRGNKAVFAGAWSGEFSSHEGAFTINIAGDQVCIE